MSPTKKIGKTIIGFIFKKMLSSLQKNLKIIVMYHRVVEKIPENLHDPNLFITSDTLHLHITEIIRHFDIVPLETLVCGENNVKRACALTFDDGWNDNYDIAFPVLRRNNVTATVFLPVNNIGTEDWFWFEHLFFLANVSKLSIESQTEFLLHFKSVVPSWNPEKICILSLLELSELMKYQPSLLINKFIESAYKRLKINHPSGKILVDWNQVNEMGRNGISFGSHGLQHDILPLLDKHLKKKAVVDSLAILREKTDFSIPFFSYPNGNWDLDTVEYLKTAGYHGATITKNGCVKQSDPYLLRRIGCSEKSSNTANLLWFQLAKAFFDSSGIRSIN